MIGSPGSGKSTLAIALAAATGLPLIHLDREYWQAGWVEPERAEWTARATRLTEGSRWVIDGNYASSLQQRLARATSVVWLDLPTRVCLHGAIRRKLRYRRGGRPDMAWGCPERLDAEYAKFLWYIITFRRRQRPEIARRLSAADVPVLHLTSTAARCCFLSRLSTGGLPVAMS